MNPPPPPPHVVPDTVRAREIVVNAIAGRPEASPMEFSHQQLLFANNVPPHEVVTPRKDTCLPIELPKVALPNNPIHPFTLELVSVPSVICLVIAKMWVAAICSGVYLQARAVLNDDQVSTKINDLMGSALCLFTPGTRTSLVGTIKVGANSIFVFRRIRVTTTTRGGDFLFLFDGMTAKALWLPVAYYAMKTHMRANGFSSGRAKYLAITYALQLIQIASGRSVELTEPLVKSPEDFDGVAW